MSQSLYVADFSVDNLKFVNSSSILKDGATLVLYETPTEFLIRGPFLNKKFKPYFIVISKSNSQIKGFYITSNATQNNIEKLSKIITSMTTCVGKDGRKFHDNLLLDISRRTGEQIILDANFYGYPEEETKDEFIDEELVLDELKNSRMFIQI
jgi:hypothetical protein